MQNSGKTKIYKKIFREKQTWQKNKEEMITDWMDLLQHTANSVGHVKYEMVF